MSGAASATTLQAGASGQDLRTETKSPFSAVPTGLDQELLPGETGGIDPPAPREIPVLSEISVFDRVFRHADIFSNELGIFTELRKMTNQLIRGVGGCIYSLPARDALKGLDHLGR